MKGDITVDSKNICKVESDHREVKIIIYKYSMGKDKYVPKTIYVDRNNLGFLIKALEIVNAGK